MNTNSLSAPGSLQLPDLYVATRSQEAKDLIKDIMVEYASSASGPVSILEAGCGRKWNIDLTDIPKEITGVDSDRFALEHRVNVIRDLDHAIYGDLRTAKLPENAFDIVYCCYVLEHIDGVETVLRNFARWVKPGGILILRFPDRNSVFGFMTRKLPFWVHILRSRLTGIRGAGQPGNGPYPTVYDPVLCREGIRCFANNAGLSITHEYGTLTRMTGTHLAYGITTLENLMMRVIAAISGYKLSYQHAGLIYALERKAHQVTASDSAGVAPESLSTSSPGTSAITT